MDIILLRVEKFIANIMINCFRESHIITNGLDIYTLRLLCYQGKSNLLDYIDWWQKHLYPTLYWTNNQENVQKAVDDGLLMNDKGYNDSQSHPVICYDKNFNEIAKFGSISECHKAIGVSKSTITRHCKNQIKTKTRKGYYFRYQSV